MKEQLRKRKMDLKCVLTREELHEKRRELVDWTQVRSRQEHDLESWKTEKREEQKLYEGEIMSSAAKLVRTAKIIEEEKEYREVEVADMIDGTTVTTLRLDTGEVVGERAATDSELQMKLNLEAEKAAAKKLPPKKHVKKGAK